MKLCFNILLLIFTTNFLSFNAVSAKFSLEGLYSKVFSKQVKYTIDKELTLGKNKTLSIENIHGNINIKTEWKQNSVILQATKQVSKKENPHDIEIKIDKNEETGKIFIKTAYKDEKITSPVHYELIVPHNIHITLKTTKGHIKAKHINGDINAQTDKGDIKISGVTGNIIAESATGNIHIAQSTGTIHTTAQYGNITIADALQNVHAQTESGFIKTACKKIVSTGSVHLATNNGNISLELPKSRDKINADIKAATKKGKLTCDHFITLKPQTLTLDKHAWARFKREVNGTIGSGEATIQLSANYGNIKISKANA